MSQGTRAGDFRRFEYRPCFVTARRIRSIPSAVRGPVESPPWFLQRVYRWLLMLHSAAALHGWPVRVFAQHRGPSRPHGPRDALSARYAGKGGILFID
jgi:hypothetical protein